MKSSIDVIGGPAGLLNKISRTATSYVDEVGLINLTGSFVARSSSKLLILSLDLLSKSIAAAAVISEDATDSEYEVMAKIFVKI